ncbi:PAN domain protein [Necator americanus]|uniref:PAN domain protein n=1 Tax=Necator americanus TaxID=51031 RepID=W2TRM4_NECAM|nr:PAN domain protein [Necator americanus]ETN84458.1 PAN domain protein [Necator americanus]
MHAGAHAIRLRFINNPENSGVRMAISDDEDHDEFNLTKRIQVYNNVDQGDCANFCSSNQGPNKEDLVCNSLNYFPLTRKCELYSILAEPHGPGTLVENQDTAVFNSIKEHCELYSEKVTKSQESIIDTPPGFVMIENGCDGNGGGSVRGRPVQNHKTIIPEEMKSLQKLPPVYLNTEDSSSEWSDCDFYVKGVRVKARTIGGQMETRAC